MPLATVTLACENAEMVDLMGSMSTVVVRPNSPSPTASQTATPTSLCSGPSPADLGTRGESGPLPSESAFGMLAMEVLQSARQTESLLRKAAKEVAELAVAQGRPDALEAVTGRNSLARGAAEVAEMIRIIEARIARVGVQGYADDVKKAQGQ